MKKLNLSIFAGITASVVLLTCATAQATTITTSAISSLNTGAGLYGAADGTVDPNWTVSLLSGTAPVALNGKTYLVPNNTVANVDPFKTHWLVNSVSSSWIS